MKRFVATTVGFVLARAWWRAGRRRPWGGSFERKAGPVWVSVDVSNRNRLRLNVGADGPEHCWVALSVGNGNSDPVWDVSVEFRPGPMYGLVRLFATD